MANDKVQLFKPKDIDYRPAAYLSQNNNDDERLKMMHNPANPGSLAARLSSGNVTA